MVDSRSAKQYSSIKYSLAVFETAYQIAFLLIFLVSGLSKNLAAGLLNFTANSFFNVTAYLFIASLAYYMASFPLSFYRSYILEHKFCLSNQKIGNWLFDELKSALVSYVIALILVEAFYYVLRRNQESWWLVISVFWILFSLILAKLTPLIIIPLFFKYKKLSDDNLKARIMSLADKMKIKILDCFEIDFSKKTLKANAAFLGLGATKRVILADTLKDKYSYDEIEVILAHEFAHYKLSHLLKLISVNSLIILTSFYLISKTSGYSLRLFGLSSLTDIAALPVIIIYFVLFAALTQPFANFISRKLETNADIMVLGVTGLKDAFISMMEKLAAQNLADINPHPVIKFFFFDHPPANERIKRAREWSA